MTAFFRATTRFLDRPLSGASRGLVLVGIVALVAGALLPLWRIQLVAPQYQEGLTLEMYTHKIAAGNGGQDLFEINTLNHYIGMKPIAQADFLGLSCGLAFAEQIMPDLPVLDHDIPLSMLATDKGLKRFASNCIEKK